MCDNWMSSLRLRLTSVEHAELPRHAAYRYQRVDGETHITPLPRYRHCRLDLTTGPGDDGQTRCWNGSVRPLLPPDYAQLPQLFAPAFREVEPFAGLNEVGMLYAARLALEQTLTGGDGPFIAAASYLATDADGPLGATLVTLLPLRDPTCGNAYYWSEVPAPDVVARRQGHPHLTWIFVRPGQAHRGVGAALLAATCARLRDLGFSDLLSTFLDGNTESMLWHWRMGFALLQHPESYRRTTRAANSG